MRIFLIGVGCVGKTAIGERLANRLGCPFYDLYVEVERHFGKPLQRLRQKALLERIFRNQYVKKVLKKLIEADPSSGFVMALPPSGLQDILWNVVRQVDRVVVLIRDSPENILSRVTFYDDDSNLLDKSLNEEERERYLEQIKKDIAYYRRSFSKADMAVDIHGLDAAQSAEKTNWRFATGSRLCPFHRRMRNDARRTGPARRAGRLGMHRPWPWRHEPCMTPARSGLLPDGHITLRPTFNILNVAALVAAGAWLQL